jgi:bifunctional DNA-binding transcriptional regulator/antitoxin component of YhaV-PrlF toxin-antitoxin module
MKEQEKDQGDILAVAAAMQIIGASYVETLDTKGTDGSNVHLGGPATITGYFGGIGQPNEHAVQWVDEYLYYYTKYGIRQVLNINPGTVLLGYLLHKLGIDMEFKISVFMGNDNPFSVLWTLMVARLFSREDDSTPLVGFNLSNSVDCQTLEWSAEIRKKLGLEDKVRIEHHITETWKSIVRQPYNRRGDLLEVASRISNISAKHEGGDPEVEQTREHASDILDYFRDKEEVLSSGDMPHLERNYLDKHDAVNRTARALTEKGLAFLAARNLHRW